MDERPFFELLVGFELKRQRFQIKTAFLGSRIMAVEAMGLEIATQVRSSGGEHGCCKKN